jgi:F-type H+-transporting ATPase subunit b
MAEPAHTTSTQAVPKGEHDGGFPPFNSHTFASQLVWLAIFFALLYVLMAKWALPQVGRVIENRQKRIADDIAEAGRLKEQSDAAVAAYEKALAEAGETSIAATKRAAMANVRAVAEDATAAIVERLIGLAPDQKTVAKAVADVLKG